jgi:serine/threonine protein phosphatase PrpC
MIEAFGISDPGCVRANNEDSYLVADDLGLYVVADGMGGAQGGERASQLAVDTVETVIRRSRRSSGADLIRAVTKANERVLAAASSDANLRGMGTTLTAALRVGSELLIAHVGDSRAYVFQRDRLFPITEDQTWVHDVGRPLGLTEEALKVHPMRHVLTMAVGVNANVDVRPYVVALEPGAQFLLCSDGLHGLVSDKQIAEILSEPNTLEGKCKNLVSAAKLAGGPDNITVVLLGERSV